MRIIIFAGSNIDSSTNYIYKQDDFIIGCDMGCDTLIKKKLPINLAIGDFDHTLNKETIRSYSKKMIIAPKEKDEIDLELALKYILNNNLKDNDIYIYNATGGRCDHELITYKMLFKYDMLNIKLISETEEIAPIKESFIIPKDNIVKRFSIISFNKFYLTIKGSYYEFERTLVDINNLVTTSNETISNKDTNVIIEPYNEEKPLLIFIKSI